ncbi:hypothetical protein EK904_009588 [Melospiza melodia maxima]|nr:hypothetical protein EK904_009588 [Melospiza melodia maxima]
MWLLKQTQQLTLLTFPGGFAFPYKIFLFSTYPHPFSDAHQALWNWVSKTVKLEQPTSLPTYSQQIKVKLSLAKLLLCKRFWIQSGSLKEPEPNKVPPQRPPPQGGPVQPQGMQSQSQEALQPQRVFPAGQAAKPAASQPQRPPGPTTQQPRPQAQGPPSSRLSKEAEPQPQPQPEPQPAPQQKPQSHPQLNKSQSLTNAFSFTESSFFRSSVNEDEAKAETIRNLRKSFASLFSD